jgi:hypothetical protein
MEFLGTGTLPRLVVAPDRPGAPVRSSPLVAGRRGWEASLAVQPGERAVNLLLKGGGPLVLVDVGLTVQPPAKGPV